MCHHFLCYLHVELFLQFCRVSFDLDGHLALIHVILYIHPYN